MATGDKETDGSLAFFRESLLLMTKSKIPFLIGGGFAFRHYTNIHRNTKDLDIFCQASQSFQILKYLKENGFTIEITDARWMAKAKKKNFTLIH